jgi:hypothetical protein
MIKLKVDEGMDIGFTIQVDTRRAPPLVAFSMKFGIL